MRCIVRTVSGEKHPFNLDRQKKIRSIRKLIGERIKEDPKLLRLIYLGKQLEDSHTLYDYSVKDNDTILVFVRAAQVEEPEYNIKSESAQTDLLPTPNSVSPVETEKNTTEPAISDVDQAAIMAAQEEAEICKKCNKSDSECKECGCNICAKKDNEDFILICDECQYYFHMYCLPTPITVVPEGDWYCPDCYNDPNKVVGADDAGKVKSKKEVKRKWDNGMACAGVLKKCTIVKSDHVGAIPGYPVGSAFQYRVHCSESGIHRPHVSGIHGSSKTRAYSIVLAGGYADDKDFGDYFFYTGSGGRDLSGNKRTADQSFDQELSRTNLALALTMNMPICQEGAVAKNWKNSSPVRVIRSYKLAKESKFAPKVGIRYDGLYKLVRYWKEPGQNGFMVWRYEFRRDDPEPAPWTDKGKQKIEELGLTMYVPEGYIPPNTKTDKTKAKPAAKGKKDKGKRGKKEESDEEVAEESEELSPEKNRFFPTKVFKPSKETLELIANDLLNARTWQLILEQSFPSEPAFLEAIMGKEFTCSICHDTVAEPVSTRCGHNACRPCLKLSLLNYGNLCPLCRGDLYPELKELSKAEAEKEIKSIAGSLSVNDELVTVFKHLIPSYGN